MSPQTKMATYFRTILTKKLKPSLVAWSWESIAAKYYNINPNPCLLAELRTKNRLSVINGGGEAPLFFSIEEEKEKAFQRKDKFRTERYGMGFQL
jgi:hypothetical protein